MKDSLGSTRQKYPTDVISVVHELIERPDLTSKEIAHKIGLSKEDLLSCYKTIQENDDLQGIVVCKSRYPRLTISASELISSHGAYLTKVLSGEMIYPLILEFHPGPVCQCQCKFCFSLNYDYGEYDKKSTPVSPERVAEIFKDCRENGIEEIWFSGGKEPFINPHTSEYLILAAAMGFKTRLYTNGIALNQEAREALLGCYQVRISVNGATSEIYYRVQFPQYSAINMDGLFNRLMTNISSLVRLKKESGSDVKIGLSQILQPDNHHEMTKFTELARSLGVDSAHFRLEAMGVIRDFTPAEKETIAHQIEELRNRDNGLEVDIRGVEEGEFESKESQFLPGLRRPSFCRAGLLKRGLNPYGALYNCEFLSHPRFKSTSLHLRLGDATKESIGDILRRSVGNYPPPCALCQAHEYGLNITLEKLEADIKWGIPVESQPYYRVRQKDNILSKSKAAPADIR